ncbi:MAG TPA: hypothetical protein VK753_07450 [Xanthomonadaceae bacterium]|jgi:hypothetical protein|nr:hypothetical protein [Xanthomonadaceae bacterium]
MSDPLQCTYEDARRNHLRDGMALSTAAKVAFFEEMIELAVRFGARDRLANAETHDVHDGDVPH